MGKSRRRPLDAPDQCGARREKRERFHGVSPERSRARRDALHRPGRTTFKRRGLEVDALAYELHHKTQFTLTQQRLNRANYPRPAADHDPLANFQLSPPAEVTRRDDLVAAAQLIAVVEARHGW